MQQIVFMYSGQGSQALDMGKDLYDKYPNYREIVQEMDPCGRYQEMMFGKDMALLSQTENTQPCMVTMAIGITTILAEHGIRPDYNMGLSLGEYSALACAEAITPKNAVDLVAYRGKIMAEGAAGRDCSMMAILGLATDKVQEACEKASSLGVVEVANYNCPLQVVIGGERVAVEEAGKIAKELGARRCMPLNVSGPFHTSLMKDVGDLLKARLDTVEFHKCTIPMVFNCTAKTLEEGETVPGLLEKQVQSSVHFEDSIRFLLEKGADTFVEIGSGKVLSGFVRKINPDVTVLNIENVETFDHAVSVLKS